MMFSYQINPITQYNNNILQHQQEAYMEQSDRVEFFNSQSSFGSSAVSESRVYDLTDQLIDEYETIFESLSETLLPREDLTNIKQVQHIVHRANIMVKQTIPACLEMLRGGSGKDRALQIQDKQQRLQQLLKDYSQYRQKSMGYELFYSLYSKRNMDFRKKISSQISVQPEVIQFIRETAPLKLQNTVRPSTPINYHETQIVRDKQIEEMRVTINRLNRQIKDLQKEKKKNEIRLKAEAEQRVSWLIKIMRSENKSQKFEVLRKELERCQLDLQTSQASHLQASSELEKADEQIRDLKYENRSLREELESYRRLSNSRVSDIDQSVMSENEGAATLEQKKLQKAVKNLTYQKNLLRSELSKARSKIYDHQKTANSQNYKLILELKKEREEKDEQILRLKKNQDEYRAKNALLKNEEKNYEKIIELCQSSVDDRFENGRKLSSAVSQLHLGSTTTTNKLSVHQYTGDGDEGYPFYELLSRQFKIRFKKSCLKQKQFLYKANGLEVGVISHFQEPNQIMITIYLSNFGDQEAIKNLKMKTATAKKNRIQQEVSFLSSLEPNQQRKCSVCAHLRTYPIGPTFLLCEYEYYDQIQEVRILLPVHVFKTLTIRPRDAGFIEPRTQTISLQRKIARDIKHLAAYFKNAKFQNQKLQASLEHKQSQTRLILDIQQIQRSFELKYEHRSGDEHMAEYIIRTLVFLLKEQH